MFYCIILMIWVLIIPTIIILSRKDLKNNITYTYEQIYEEKN